MKQSAMSIYSSKRKRHRISRSQIGHLKLSIYEESSALIVHIFEARGLARDSTTLDTYVKLYLLPDPHKLTKEKTRIVRQKDPVFNQRFCFLLSEQDLDKRLFLSLWTHHTTSRNEMVGSMSFLVSDLLGPNKGLNGWYQLLDEQKGRNENVKVPTSLSKYEGTPGFGFQKPGQQTFAVTLVRSISGYGFNVNGHNPVCISSLVEGLPAQKADIRVGDTIVEVEGTDVTMADAEHVASIVSKCSKVLRLVLQRSTSPYQSSPTSSVPFTSTPYSATQQDHTPLHHSSALYVPRVPDHHGTRRFSSPTYTLTQPEFVQDTPTIYPHWRSMEGQRGGLMRQTVAGGTMSAGNLAAMSSRRFSSLSQHYRTSGSQEQLVGTMGPIGPSASVGSFTMSQPREPAYDGYAPRHSARYWTQYERGPARKYYLTQQEVEGGEGHRFTRTASLSPSRHAHHLVSPSSYSHRQLRDSRGNMSSNSSITQSDSAYASGPSNQSTHMRLSPDKNFRPRPEERGVSMATHHYDNGSSLNGLPRSISEEEVLVIHWESLGSLGQKRQRAINKVMDAELAFNEELESGITTYLEPLRPILSDITHRTMFMNVEELYATSEELASLLKSRRIHYSSHDPAPIKFYFTAVADIYYAKLSKLASGLERYLQGCFAARQEISVAFTNEDFTQLVQESVVSEKKPSIYSFVEAGKEYLSKLTRFMMAVSYYTPLCHEDHHHLTAIIEVLMKLCPERGLAEKWERDQETMRNLSLCISFGPRVRQFQVVVPGRLLLHEGEATLVEKKRKRKIWMLLFSDILLLTRRHGKILSSIESPISLDNLLVQDINCTEATEFQIATTESGLCRQLRMATLKEKAEWMQKLRERAAGSLTNRRRTAEKVRPLPRIDAPRRQHHVSSEGEDSAFMTTIPEGSMPTGGIGAKEEEGREEMEGQDREEEKEEGKEEGGGPSEDLQRDAPRRRSLFNVGASKAGKEKEKEKKRKTSKAVKDPSSLNEVGVDVLSQWEGSLESLLQDKGGIKFFEQFLKSEFSEENIQFWKACKKFKEEVPTEKLQREAKDIFEKYISPSAPKLVNIDHQTTKEIVENMKSPSRETFEKAQHSIYLLMARDSYVRFIRSEAFQSAVKREAS